MSRREILLSVLALCVCVCVCVMVMTFKFSATSCHSPNFGLVWPTIKQYYWKNKVNCPKAECNKLNENALPDNSESQQEKQPQSFVSLATPLGSLLVEGGSYPTYLMHISILFSSPLPSTSIHSLYGFSDDVLVTLLLHLTTISRHWSLR